MRPKQDNTDVRSVWLAWIFLGLGAFRGSLVGGNLTSYGLRLVVSVNRTLRVHGCSLPGTHLRLLAEGRLLRLYTKGRRLDLIAGG